MKINNRVLVGLFVEYHSTYVRVNIKYNQIFLCTFTIFIYLSYMAQVLYMYHV